MARVVWYSVPDVCEDERFKLSLVGEVDVTRPFEQEGILEDCAEDFFQCHDGHECLWPLVSGSLLVRGDFITGQTNMKDDTEQSTSVEARQSDKASLDRIGRRVAARNIDDGTDSFIIGVEPDEAAVQQRSGDGQAWLSKYVTVLEDNYQFHRARYRFTGDRYDIGVADGIDVALGWLRGLGSEGQSKSNTGERMDS